MLGTQAAAVVMTAVALAGAVLQSPEDLLRRSDIGAFAPKSFRARLVLKSLPQAVSHEIEIWRSGDAKTLIRFLDPKDRGKYLLRLEGQVWLLTPDAKKPVHLSPSYRLYGGATLDEVLGIRLAREYRVESASRETDPGGPVVALELIARSEGVLFPRVRYVVREATERPVSATYQLRSGRDATAVEFLQWNEGRLVYARRVVVKDLLRKGALTEVEIPELQERSIPEGLFSLGDAAARRALESATSKEPANR
jgi:hypothetical protein